MTLQEIANVTGHQNLETLKDYLELPTVSDKARASDALTNYRKNVTTSKHAEPNVEEIHVAQAPVASTSRSTVQTPKKAPKRRNENESPRLTPVKNAKARFFSSQECQLMAYGIGQDLVEQAVSQEKIHEEYDYEQWKSKRAMNLSQVDNISMSTSTSTTEGRKYNFGGATFHGCTFKM